MYRYLIMLTIASTVGLQAWLTLFNNFAVEVAGLDGKHVGVIQSVREIPGFLALLAIYVMLIVKEHRLSALSILLLGIGLGVTGMFPTFTGLMMATLISSFGFHYQPHRGGHPARPGWSSLDAGLPHPLYCRRLYERCVSGCRSVDQNGTVNKIAPQD